MKSSGLAENPFQMEKTNLCLNDTIIEIILGDCIKEGVHISRLSNGDLTWEN